MARQSVSDESLYDYFLWDHPTCRISEEQLQRIMENVCKQYSLTRDTTGSVVFYPYSNLKSTIRIENGCTRVRLSDILCNAPEAVLEALLHILIARASHRKPHPSWIQIFNGYIHRPEVEAHHSRIRQERNRKVLSHSQGTYFDLEASFERVNQRYFNGSLSKPTLSWSPFRSRRQLGYHDAALNLIVISRSLDRRGIPEFLVDFIMYHELLHTVIRPKLRREKRVVHSQEFKRKEQEFDRYEEAIRWLQTMRS